MAINNIKTLQEIQILNDTILRLELFTGYDDGDPEAHVLIS